MRRVFMVKQNLLQLKRSVGLYVIVLMLSVPASVWSTHIVGGSISYKCLGNDQYEITLTVRRDCILGADDAPFDDPASVGIFDQDGLLLTAIGDEGELLMSFQSDETLNNEINQICYADQSSICVHITQYVGIVELPAIQGGYTLAYQRCCRNSSLNNIVDPLNTGMTLFIDMTEEALALCNNSPQFNLRPDIFICAGEALSFDAAAIDEEGDVLVYSLCTPFAGATQDQPIPQPPGAPPYTPVAWAAGFNAGNTLGNNDFSIDPGTGAVTGTPGFIGQYLIGLCVEEYRNGVLLSITHREFQYNVVNCNDEQVVADFDVSQSECGLDDIVFTNKSTPGSSYTWFFDYPSEESNLISTEESPTFSYGSPGRYSIRLIAENTETNCQSIIDKDITISDGTEAEFSTTILSCTPNNELNVRLSDETGLDAVERVWELVINGRLVSGTSKSIEFTAAKDAQITASLTVNGQTGCLINQSQEIDLNIDQQVQFEYEIITCDAQIISLRLTDKSNLEVGLIQNSLSWTILRENGNIISRDGSDIDIDVFENETIQVTQTVLFTNGCTASNSQNIDLDLNDLASFETDLESCTPGIRNMALVTFRPSDGGIPINGTLVSQEWLVVNGETEFRSTDNEITLDLDFSSPVWVGHTVQYSNGCTANEERKIKLNELFDADVDINSTIESCTDDEVTVRFFNNTGQIDNNTAIILQKAWRITTADGHWADTGPFIEYTGRPGEIIEVYFIFNANNGCAFEQTKIVELGADDEALNFTDQIVDCDGDQISIQLTDNRNSDRTDWIIYTNGSPSNRSGREIIIRVNRNDEVIVKLQTDTAGACEESDGKLITSNPDDLLSFSIAQIDCLQGGIELQFVDTSPSIGGAIKSSIDWVFQTSAGQTFSATGNSTTQLFEENDIITIMMDVLYSNGCRATLIESLDLNFDNALDYDVRLISCNGPNQFTIELTANTEALPIDEPISNYVWDIANGELAISRTGQVVQLDVNMNEAVKVELGIMYDDGCSFAFTDELSFDDIFGDGIEREDDVEINIDPQICDSDDITYSINNRTTFVLDNTARVISKEWKITSSGILNGDINDPENDLSDQRNICESENTISILGQTLKAETGSLICIPFLGYNFTAVGSIQTAFAWDPNVLTYNSFNEGALSDIDLNTAFVDDGELRMVWLVDFSTTQVTVADNTPLFEICFTATGGIGSATEVSFNGIQNLAIEITNENLEIVDACLQAAKIEVVEAIDMTNSMPTNTMITGSGDEISFTGEVGDELNVMLTMELDNGCILILNETFTVAEIDLDFFNDFPDLTLSDDGNAGNQGGTNTDGDGSQDGGTQSGDSGNESNTGSGSENVDAIIVVCDGQARPLISNPNPDWTYEWAPTEGLIFNGDDRSNPLALPDQTSTYMVTVTAGGCSTTGSITVIPADEFRFTITNGGTDACHGEVNLSVAAAPGAVVEWSLDSNFNSVFATGHTLSTDQVSASVQYYVRQIFEGGCVSPIESFTIENLSLEILGVQIDPITNDSNLPICSSNPIAITATTNGNPADIQWVDQETNAVIGTGATINVDATDVTNIRAALDGGNGCIVNTADVALVPYDINQDIDLANSDIPQLFCTGLDTPISLSILSDDDLEFLWSQDPCIISGGTTASPVINATANKDLTVSITNLNNGCTDQLVIPVRISSDEMTFEITGDSDICTDDVSLTASQIEEATVQWSLDESFTTILAEGNQLSTTQDEINQRYFARQILEGGCISAFESVEVNKNDIIIDGLNTETNTLAFCDDQITTITASTAAGPENITWYDATNDQLLAMGSPFDVDPSDVNMIYGTVIGVSGCEIRTETIMLIPFNLDELVDLNLGENDGIPNGVCAGESTQINVTNLTDLDLIYEWGPIDAIEAGGSTASPTINLSEDTELTLRITNPETDCVIEVPIPIVVTDPMLELFADPSARIYLGSDVEILAETDAVNPTYTWSTGETTPTITVEPTENTSYTVTITDENGCTVVSTIDVTVITDCSGSGIYLPNAFSPNGDGSNDELFVRTNSLRDVTLVIFDRWGREVFQTNNKDIGWNGRWQNNGDALPPDAYGYMLSAVCFTGEEYTQQGNVSILR